MSKQLAVQRGKELLAVLERVAMDDARISQAANRALSVSKADLEAMTVLNDAELKAKGWTREEFETAYEARKPRSETAYVVQMAHERTGMRIRQAVERSGTTVNVAVVMPAPAVVTDAELDEAPVIDVSEER